MNLNFSYFKKYSKLPTFSQWRRFPNALTKREKNVFIILFILFCGSFIFLVYSFYLNHTKIEPTIGGIYKEGVIGQPRFINPIYAASNDVDRDLIELLFSGLMKYNRQGQIVPDLARDYPEIKEEGTIYEIYLREGAVFHDGKKVSADDVIFTVKTIQNPDFKSPLRANWLGVKVEKISEKGVRFKLKTPYPSFLERLTLKILPAHIWQNVSPQNFPLSSYNFKPVGSGSFKFKNLEQDKSGAITSLELERFPDYFGKKPYLSQVSFCFFDKEEALIKAFNEKEIDGFSLASPQDYNLIKTEFQELNFVLPRYFALFFNPSKNKLLATKEIRQALNYGTDKIEIIEKILSNKAKVVNSPILPEVFGYDLPSETYSFDAKKAEALLEKAGLSKKDGKLVKIIKEKGFEFKIDLKQGYQGEEVKELQKCLSSDSEVYPEAKVTGFFGPVTKKAVIRFQEKYASEILEPLGLKKGTGKVGRSTREKLNEVCVKTPEKTLPFKLSLITVKDPILTKVAELLKTQWEKLGIEVEVKTYSISLLKQDFIKQRNYELLLFGEILGFVPDLFPFWHSSQKRDPGLNLSLYENKSADKLLEEARTQLNPETRAKIYKEFQDILIKDAPCVFLYSPDYIYLVNKEIKGIHTIKSRVAGAKQFNRVNGKRMIVDPSKRFCGIENWYVQTRRAWK